MSLGTIHRVVRPVAVEGAATVDRAVVPDVVATDGLRDVAILRVPGIVNAPSLALARGQGGGTSIATLGFDAATSSENPDRHERLPVMRTGIIGPLDGSLGRDLTLITTDVMTVHTGGPVVDANGRVRAFLLMARAAGGGAIVPADQILRVLDRADAHGYEGRTQSLWRRALARAGKFDLTGARADLRRVLDRYPAHGLARYELDEVDRLGDATLSLVGVRWFRGGLLAAGFTALLIAALTGGLLWKALTRDPGVRGPRDRTAPFDHETGGGD
ncbi:MAG: serine protease [Thermoleophilia bacterium]|nr:serine protease [Thermoleophilia bacterium]